MEQSSIYLSVKSLVYKELEPIARSLGMKLLILDAKTYGSFEKDLQSKMRVFGISQEHLRLLREEIVEFGAVAVLKSSRYLGPGEIAPHFSKYRLSEDAIHFLNSTNNKRDRYKPWGDFSNDIPEKKRMFLYWISLDVEEPGGDVVLEGGEDEMKYSKQKIAESVRYWKNQLRAGNYSRVDESEDLSSRNGEDRQKAKRSRVSIRPEVSRIQKLNENEWEEVRAFYDSLDEISSELSPDIRKWIDGKYPGITDEERCEKWALVVFALAAELMHSSRSEPSLSHWAMPMKKVVQIGAAEMI